jgi:hypothetical protein
MAVGMVAQLPLFRQCDLWIFTHALNGTGVSDFGDIMIMPTMGAVSFDNKTIHRPFTC